MKSRLRLKGGTNLIRGMLRRTNQPPAVPAWVSEVITEVEAVQPGNSSTDRAEPTTGTLHTVVSSGNRQRQSWHILSGDIVRDGDTVVTDIGPTSTGTILGPGWSDQLARVRLLTGPGAGEIRDFTPGQMMRRQPPHYPLEVR